MAPRGRPRRSAIHERLEQAVAELRSQMGGLPSPAEARDIWTLIWHREAHNSTALEGNTLILSEVEALLRTGQVVGQRELKHYLEVKGYADAAEWVYGQAIDRGGRSSTHLLTLQEVREVHHCAMRLVWEVAPHPQAGPDEAPGNWRRNNITQRRCVAHGGRARPAASRQRR